MKKKNYTQVRLMKKRRIERRIKIVMTVYYAICAAIFILFWSVINGVLDPSISDSRYFSILGLFISIFLFISLIGWIEFKRLLGIE